ncbi:hypothetical protein A3B45_02545 [Candidatus Daviesbacteria bacterium RIFCSPLOWO2_01_FULL_39_12]|uniref:YoaR-like putative peptidoglycan binding domain-containing protein n=1 Tax=Candidatus Daviesbacteria bacterium RIFCSPLOWO2_01_FULL_39_12 TaxID=1797785 RepID=A0A1F5KST2_9BACT|nr:MAG: hypothetical protein A3B45_02545 [Candidatus Daviesbacteria bacterium RIFCSPLOWO2_01_FULL_39_12]
MTSKSKKAPKKTAPVSNLTQILHFLPVFLSLVLIFLTFLAYELFMSDKFYPFTSAGDTSLSFLSLGQSASILADKISQRSNQTLEFNFNQKIYSVDLATASARLDYASLESEFQKTHPSSLYQRLTQNIPHLFTPKLINPKINITIDSQLNAISTLVFRPSQKARLIFDETDLTGTSSAKIQIKEGVNGLELDKDSLTAEVKNYLLSGQYAPNLPVKIIHPQSSPVYLQKLKAILEQSLTEPVKLEFEQKEWVIDTKQLLTILDLESGQNLILDKDKSLNFLTKIAQEIDQEVQEGHFEFSPQTRRVSVFKPSIEGRKLDVEKTFALILETLQNLAENPKIISLPVDTIEPKIKTSDVNNLGIKELLGQGVSRFAGSIQNRIYNIQLAASRINGVLIAPGETFSFNAEVGDISAASGYKQAYVIKSGRTVLDDGGGVCQVSTTVFRAVLNAGLPVVQRVAHAYRVGYYEQGFPPGLDATIFAPSVDFQFKNDTQNHILIQAYTSGTTLYVDLYGTPDGRFVSLTKSSVTNLTPPPPELRQDDPTLPKGEVKQVDWPAWGATVQFSRTVKRGTETLIQETFKSNYKAWQAVYLVGTKE